MNKKEMEAQRSELWHKANELNSKASELSKQIEVIEEQERSVRHQIMLSHIDGFIAAVPDHNRNCSDEKMGDTDRCLRCALLLIKQERTWPDHLRLRIEFQWC